MQSVNKKALDRILISLHKIAVISNQEWRERINLTLTAGLTRWMR